MVAMMEITTNKPLNLHTLQIIKDGFEEQKNVIVLSLYAENNDVYGIYLNPLSQLLSFIEQPLYSMSTDIDGHNIFMMELGSLLHLVYHNASIQMYQWLCHPSDIIIRNEDFDTLIEYCEEYPPYQLASFHLINWVEELNNGNLNMSTFDLVDMFKIFMKNEPLDIDFDASTDEIYLKNQLNQASQILKTKKYKKISEAEMHQIDRTFINLQKNNNYD